MIGSRSVPALAKGASSSATSPVTIPAALGGNFYLVALANAGAGGALNGNNAKAKAINIGADLTVTALTSPGSVGAGAVIAVSDTTRNTAPAAAAAPASTTRYFLSPTSSLGAGAVQVGSRAVPPLSGGASSAGAVTVTIPAGTAPGSYFLIARADGADAIAEYSETNNVRARAITVAN
jgi:subtilase family serine protease